VVSPDLLPEPAIVLDGEGTIHHVNAEAAACFGRTVEDIVGGDLSRLVTHPGQITDAIAAADGDEAWRCELVARRADGVPFPLDVSGRVIDRGPPPRTLALLHDRNVGDGVPNLAQRHFEVAFDRSPIGMGLYNTDGRFVRANAAMCQLLGRDEGELIGMRDQELTHPDDRDTDLDAARRILAGEIETFQTEKRFVRPGGEVVWVIANLTFLRDEHDRPISWLGQFQDVTEHRRLAERDSLTQLFNRRRFEQALAEHLRHGARYEPSGALLVFDLDGFKAINDGYGHPAGDEVLVEVARAVGGRMRETDVVARLGGDEFGVVTPHVGAEAEILGWALVELIAGLHFSFAGDRPLVTASVGIAPFAAGLTDSEPLLAAADAALYEVKRAGGNACASRAPE